MKLIFKFMFTLICMYKILLNHFIIRIKAMDQLEQATSLIAITV